MNNKFKSKQISGHGRGRRIGFPTINMVIPDGFLLKEGIYAVRILISERYFIGAMHFGPIPTFGEKEKSLEVFLIDVEWNDLSGLDLDNIEVEVVKYLREIENFPDQEKLKRQISLDVDRVKKVVRWE